jgi:hypothetical protein
MTYADFLEACEDAEFPFVMKVTPFAHEGMWEPPSRQMQFEVYESIVDQLTEHVTFAQQNYPDDEWRPVQALAAGLKLVDIYVEQGFNDLVPLQQGLQQTLHTRWRMARRAFIRNASKRPDPSYEKIFKSEAFNENRWGHPGDIAEDFAAAKRCVDHSQA